MSDWQPVRGRGGGGSGRGGHSRGGSSESSSGRGRGHPRGGSSESSGGRGRGHPRGGSSESGRGGGGSDRGGGSRSGDRGGYRGPPRGGGAFSGFQEPLVFNPPGEPLEPPSAEVRNAEDRLVAGPSTQASKTKDSSALSLAGLSLSETPKLPRRPGYGTIGRPIVLRANYFQVIPKPDLQIFRYHVDIIPGTKVTRKKRRIFDLLVETVPALASARPAIATDRSAIIVTLKKLALGSTDSVEGQLMYYEAEEVGPKQEKPIVYEYKIQYTNTLSVQELLNYLSSTNRATHYDGKEAVIQALNIAMMRKPMADPTVSGSVRLNRFFPTGSVIGQLGGGLVALQGYYTSVRTSTLRLLLNVNSITATFYRPIVVSDLIKEFKSANRDGGFRLTAFLKGLRVEIKHLKTKKGMFRTRVIAGIARDPVLGASAKQVKFTWTEKNETVSVERYFLKQYNIQLQEPDLPVVNVGNAQHPNWLPAELCRVLPGQSARQKLSQEQTAEMIKVACRRPAANARLVVGEGAELLGLKPEQKDGPSLFGLQVKPKMITVDGRILPPPTISYGGNSNVSSAAGSWNMIKQRFCVGAKIQSWTYLEVREGSRSLLYEPLIDLMKEFRRMMQTCGLDVAVPNPPTGLPAAEILAGPHPSNETKLDGYFSRIAQKKEASMLLIVLPAKLQGLYSIIKYLTDVKYGLHTVCCVAAKLGNDRGRPQYLANVALKWNLKRGGVNQQVSPGSLGILTKTRTMVVGIDVTHPSPGSMEEAPSVAGVVASINDRFAQWPASVRIQKGREEMVQELDAMMEQRLRTYQRLSGNLPQNILVYRDGVSEGQYARVLDEESPQIQKAIGRVYPANAIKPKVSIIIVGKRHHTRFYPTREDEADRSGNPKNGTVVDRGVTGERQWDFFLQAHMGLQGTARPAHYVVIQDGIGLGVDGLEQMTHSLCYLFGRATKAVSICPPAYYADLLCERARCYLQDVYAPPIGESGSTSSKGKPKFDAQRAKWREGVHQNLKDSMFYV